jgi:hypothetical protein
VQVFLGEPLVLESGSVSKSSATLTAIATGLGTLQDDVTWWNASLFIDATYDGDLLVQAGCSWTYGREASAQYGEKYAGVQPYTTFGQFLVDVDPIYNGKWSPAYNPNDNRIRR